MRRSHVLILALLFVGYASFYLCRANLEAALPLLVHEGYAKTRLGQLSSIATFTYAIGKVVMGAAGDRIGGRRIIGLAVAGSVVFSLAFGLSRTFLAMVVFAACNRFFQSGGWSGLVHVVSRWFAPRMHGRVMGVLSTSYELGNVCALTLSGFVAHWGWRALFVVNPLLFALIGGSVVASLPRAAPPDDDGGSSPSPAAPPEGGLALGEILRTLFTKGSFLVALAMSCLLTFIRIGFLTWTPTYLYEMSRALGREEISGAIVKSAMFPAAGVVAALAVGAIADRFGPGRRAPIMSASLTMVVAFVLLLAHGQVREPLGAALLIAAVGLFLLGPYSLLAGAVALDVAGTRGTATATGMIDSAGYLGATAAPFVLGAIVDRAGWSAAFDVIAVVAAVAVAISGAWSIVALRARA
jgi:sugar phosphate permease